MYGAAHTYEEIREVIIDILLKKEVVSHPPEQFGNLLSGAHEVFCRREIGPHVTRFDGPQQHPQDGELIRDVFWDLFRQGVITLGMNNNNENWPFFRLSHLGKETLASSNPYRFHSTTAYINLLKAEAPGLQGATIMYIEEAVSSYHSGNMLAACVMMGVAAECEFLHLVEVAATNSSHGAKFSQALKEKLVKQKIEKFKASLATVLPHLPNSSDVEDVGTKLDYAQSVIRIARNDAGHPSGISAPVREMVYINLQLFIHFAKLTIKLQAALA